MGAVIKELVQRGHDMAAELNASCGAVDMRSVAKLISDLASQLDVQLVRGNQIQQQLAAVVAENAGLKSKGREVLKEAAYVYSHYNRMVEHLDGESIDGQTLHELQVAIEAETPATNAYLAEAEARGVDKFATELGLVYKQLRPGSNHAHALKSTVFRAVEFAAQLRQGAAL